MPSNTEIHMIFDAMPFRNPKSTASDRSAGSNGMGGSGSFAGPFGKMLRQPLALLSLESVLCSTTLPTVLERGDASFVGISDPPLITSASTIGGAPSSVSPFELGRRIAAPRDMTNLRPGACGENAKTAAAGIIKRRNTSTMENRIFLLSCEENRRQRSLAPKVNLVLSRVFQDTDFFKKRKKSVVVVVGGGGRIWFVVVYSAHWSLPSLGDLVVVRFH